MLSIGKGSLSATTQVKVWSPEILHVASGQGFHDLEAEICSRARGECGQDEPGSKSVAGKRNVDIGTWENLSAPIGSIQGAEKVTRMYGVWVVGLIRSRGVSWVMPAEFQREGTLEGVSGLKRGAGI